jgi:hypothetical protein
MGFQPTAARYVLGTSMVRRQLLALALDRQGSRAHERIAAPDEDIAALRLHGSGDARGQDRSVLGWSARRRCGQQVASYFQPCYSCRAADRVRRTAP